MKVGDEEGNVVTLTISLYHPQLKGETRWYWFSSENHESLCAHHHEPCKLVTQDLFNLICLFDGDAETDRIDRWLDEDTFGFVTGYDEGEKEDLGGCPGSSQHSSFLLANLHRSCVHLEYSRRLYFGLVMAFHLLRCKVLQGQSGGEGGPHRVEVRPEGVGLWSARLHS